MNPLFILFYFVYSYLILVYSNQKSSVCDVKLKQSYYLGLTLYFQDDLYLCSTRQPVSTRKPLDSGYQEEDYRYLYKIPWSLLTGGGVHQQPAVKNQR